MLFLSIKSNKCNFIIFIIFKWLQALHWIKNNKSGESRLSIHKWIERLNIQLNLLSIMQSPIAQINNKLHNRLKNIWIKNFTEDGSQL